MARILRCHNCLSLIHEGAEVCHHCNEPVGKRAKRRLIPRGAWTLALVVVGVFALGDGVYLYSMRHRRVAVDTAAIKNLVECLQKGADQKGFEASPELLTGWSESLKSTGFADYRVSRVRYTGRRDEAILDYGRYETIQVWTYEVVLERGSLLGHASRIHMDVTIGRHRWIPDMPWVQSAQIHEAITRVAPAVGG